MRYKISQPIPLLSLVSAFLLTPHSITQQMSEEIQNPSVNVPRSMMTGITLNGFLGFGMLLAVLFCLGDVDAALHTRTGYPFIEIFRQAVGTVGGATAMTIIVVALGICGTIGFLASSSRMTWAFARDRGLPGWAQLSKVIFSIFSSPITTRFPSRLAETKKKINRLNHALQSPSSPLSLPPQSPVFSHSSS